MPKNFYMDAHRCCVLYAKRHAKSSMLLDRQLAILDTDQKIRRIFRTPKQKTDKYKTGKQKKHKGVSALAVTVSAYMTIQ